MGGKLSRTDNFLHIESATERSTERVGVRCRKPGEAGGKPYGRFLKRNYT